VNVASVFTRFELVRILAKNKIKSTSNTSIVIVDSSRLHVSTLIGSSSGLLFETSLQNTAYNTGIPLMFTNNREAIASTSGCLRSNSCDFYLLCKLQDILCSNCRSTKRSERKHSERNSLIFIRISM